MALSDTDVASLPVLDPLLADQTVDLRAVETRDWYVVESACMITDEEMSLAAEHPMVFGDYYWPSFYMSWMA